jgi:hypothetical protein
VDHSSAYYLRKRDADFAQDWAAALAEGRGRLAAGRTAAGGAGAGAGRGGARIAHGRPCIARVGPGRWSAGKEAAFLAALEESGNVSRAARAARISTPGALCAAQPRAGLRQAWAAAVRGGYLDVEALLIENARRCCRARAAAGPRGHKRRLKDDMSVADAINILKLHRASVKGGAPQRYGWRAAEPDIEEVRAEILRKVEAMERRARG